MVITHAFVGGNGGFLCALDGCGESRFSKVHSGSAVTEMQAAGEPVLKPEALQAWDAFSARVRDLIAKKNAAYGDAWHKRGFMGNAARIMIKADRLQNMVWRDDADSFFIDSHGESIEDTVVDMAALCAFFAANFEDRNRWGQR